MRALSVSMSVVSSITLVRRPHRHLHVLNRFLLGKKQTPQSLVNQACSGFRLIISIPCSSLRDQAEAHKITVPTSVPVRVAYELLQAGHHYLDVRTPDEFSAGHPLGAVNVPYMYKAGDGMQKNPDFLEHVLKHFGKDDEIIVGCQSGRRSLMAAADLSSAGFSGVTDIAGGYSSWRQTGLPTE